ncbi:MAG: NifB/NifX family molybdenum-iron cluster-binding protein [Thermoleophilia bacterium]|mgnify:CR=1 FL=1
MKIIISAQGNDIDSLTDPRFGRCRYLIAVETTSGEWHAHDNQDNAAASGGAGVEASNRVVSLGAAAVITGNLGPNAARVLDAAHIAVYRAENGATVREAVAAFAADGLERIDAPTVQGHWM